MGEQRRIARRGNSLVVPVPRAIRAHLNRLDGGDVFWYIARKGEAVVSTAARRVGGKPLGARLDRDLGQALREIERLRGRLAARPAAIYNEGVNEGRTRHLGELIKLGAQLDTLTAAVRALDARLPFSARARAQPPTRPRSVAVIPAPVLAPQSSSPE